MTQAIEGQGSKSGEFRRGLMLYGSTAALAASLMLAEGGIGPAMAQEIGPRVSPSVAAQGDFIVTGPSPTPFFEYRTGSLDIINMRRDAVLNWTTYDTAPPGGVNGNSYVNFLPEGAELRFVGNGESFTAVNRVFTNPDNAGVYRGITFQGRVTSHLFGDGPGSVGPVGGNIWFFSPGGILATGTASFNVGSLLLSTSDLQNFTEGGGFRAIDFTGVADAFSAVVLQNGSRVTLTQPNSNFTIVAPTIEQGSEATVNGSVLYLSAEQGSLTFYNDGTGFASVGTEAAAGNHIRHLGTTTGPASLGTDDFTVFDPQTVEFRTGRDVGVLLSGAIGYAGATDAALGPNGTILLSTGPVATQGDLTLTSNTFIEAPSVDLRAAEGATIAMGQDANGVYDIVISAPDATVAATGGGLIDIAGSLTLSSPGQRSAFSLDADGGRIEVGGDLRFDATVGRFQQGGQTGGSIEANVFAGGSIAVGGALTLDASAYAYEGDNGVTHAQGGDVTLTIDGAGSSLAVGTILSLIADGASFSGLCECSPPNSGSATGGYAGVAVGAGAMSAPSLVVSASGEAYTNEFSEALGHSLEARGGTADIRLGDSVATIGIARASANASGAEGADGEIGGAATGGFVRFEKGAGGSLSLGSLSLRSNASGGHGGGASEGAANAADGGAAIGGTAVVAIGQDAPGLTYLVLEAEGQGGDGGAGSNSGSGGLSGAQGGTAQGGTASLTVSGTDTRLTAISEGSLSVAATGGGGGHGAPNFFTGQAGDAGAGGAATGGALTVTAAGGAEFRLNLVPALAATGGTGGSGANGFTYGEAQEIVEPGRGGVGGDATGATVDIVADGGTISGNLELDVRGFGGEGGPNGYDANENGTGSANFGQSQGGAILLSALDDGASRIDVGFAALLATGDVSGTISVLDEASDPAAAVRFGSLAAYASGNAPTEAPTFRLSAAAGPVTVDGTAEIYADSIALDFTGSGQLSVGGFTLLNTYQGDLAITHADNVGVDSVVSTGPFTASANGSYIASAGSRVRGFDSVTVQALGSIDAADTAGSAEVVFIALGDATVGNAAAGGAFELFAGRLDNDGTIAYYPSATARVTGTVTASTVTVTSGGFAEFASGSSVGSDNAIAVRTGDDIVVAAGAALVSDIDPNQDLTISLLAGDIDVGPSSGDLVEPITTPIASLVIRGTLDTNGRSMYLSGDAIDAAGSSIDTGSLYADVTDAPFMPPYSNDGGLLTDAACFQGRVCFGTVVASDTVRIGLASNNGLISLAVAELDFDGAEFEVTTREGLSLGTPGTAGTLAASNRIALISTSGDVTLTDLTLTAAGLRIDAGSEILASSSTLSSPAAIRLSAGQGMALGTVATGQRLDDGSGGAVFTTPGYFTANSIQYGNGNAIRIDAGGAIAIGLVDAGSAAIELVSDAGIFVGATDPATSTILLDGLSVDYDQLSAVGLVQVTARGGDITSDALAGPGIDTAGDIALNASGEISVGRLDAGGSIAATAGGSGAFVNFASGADSSFAAAALELGSGTAGGDVAAQTSAGNIGFTAIEAAGDGTFDASSGIVGGDVAVGGNLSLIGAALALDAASGALGVTADIVGTAGFTSLSSSSGAVALAAGGAIAGTLIDAATDAALTGTDVAVTTVLAGGDISLGATSLTASLLEAGGDIAADVEGSAAIGSAEAGGNLSVAAGAIDAGDLVAGLQLQLTGQSLVQVDSAVAGSDLAIVSGGAVEAGSLATSGALSVDAEGAAAIGDFASDGGADLGAASLVLGAGAAGGHLIVQARSGDLAFGELSAGGAADLFAAGELAGGDVTASETLDLFGATVAVGAAAGGAGVTVGAELGASFVSLASSDGSVSVDGGDLVTGGTIAAAVDASVTGGAVSLVGMTAGRDAAITAGSLEVETLSAGRDISANIAGDAALGAADAGGAMILFAAGDLAATTLTAAGAIDLTAEGAARLGSAAAGGNLAVGATTLVSDELEAGGMIDVATDGLAAIGAFTSGSDAGLSAGALDIGTGVAGGNLDARANAGSLAFTSLEAADNADLYAAGDIIGGDVAAGGTLALFGGTVTVDDASAVGALSARSMDAIDFASLVSADGSVLVGADGEVTGGTILAGGDVTLGAAALLIEGMNAGGAIALDIAGSAEIGTAGADAGIAISAGSLLVGAVDAGETLDIDVSGAATLLAFTSGGDAAISGGSLLLVEGSVGGVLEAQADAGDLDFGALSVAGDADLTALGALSGGNIAAGGTLTLAGASIGLDTASGAAGLDATTPGAAFFTTLASSSGAVALDAGGAVAGGDARAALGIVIAGDSVSLGTASFGAGLTVTAQGGDIAGAGLYQGTGPVSLTAAQGIAIASVDTLGAITLDAGADARFVELRSRDGALGVMAGGSIAGSSVAAVGENAAGDDSVSLVAGGAVTLDGAATTLNPFSRAQDDVSISAGGAVTVGRVAAGADLALQAASLTAGRLVAGAALDARVDGAATVGEASAGTQLRLAAGSLDAGTLGAGTTLDVAANGELAVSGFTSGGDANVRSASAILGTGVAGGALRFEGFAGNVAFESLTAGADLVLAGAGSIAGGDAAAGGRLQLSANDITIGAGSGMLGIEVTAGGAVTFATLTSGAGSVAVATPGDMRGGSIGAAGDIAIDARDLELAGAEAGGDIGVTARSLAAASLIAGGQFEGNIAGDAQVAELRAGAELGLTAVNLTAEVIAAGGDLDLAAMGAASVAAFTSGGDAVLTGGALTLGTGAARGTLTGAATAGDLVFEDLAAGGDVVLSASAALRGDRVAAGGELALGAQALAIGTAASEGDLAAEVSGDARFGSLESAAGSIALDVGGAIDVTTARAAEALMATADGTVLFGAVTSGGNLTIAGGTLDIAVATVGGSADLAADGTARIGEAGAAGEFLLRAGSLAAGSLRAGGALDVATSGSAAIESFAAAGGATLSGATLDLGSGEVTGALVARSSLGDLAYGSLAGSGDMELDAAQALRGGDARATGRLSLRGASIAIGTGEGGSGIVAMTPGSARFSALDSAAGAVAVSAGGAAMVASAKAAGAIAIAASDITLDAARFGAGLRLTAGAGDIAGTVLYQGTGAVELAASRGIAIGSVDTLGNIAIEAGAEARFVELRSRDGSVAVAADGAISGSSVAAVGSDAAGDDSVSLVAGGAITLDGLTTALNAGSTAQDDFSARAGGTIAIVRAAAGRDLSLDAGAGTVRAADFVAGRDLALTGQAVDLAAGTVERNLAARASGGDITGSGTIIVGGAIDLVASGAIAVGSLDANGGGIAAVAGAGIAFTNLEAAGAVTLSAGSGIAATGDITAGGAVGLDTVGGATGLRDITSGGAVALAGGGALTMRDVVQNANGSLTISYDGAIVLRDAAFATQVAINGDSSVEFRGIASPGGIAIDAAGAVTGGSLAATNALVVSGASLDLGTVAVGEGDARLDATAGALAATSVAAVDIIANATGGLAIATTLAAQSASLSGALLALGRVAAGTDLALASASEGGITAGDATAGGALSVAAGAQGFAGGNVDAGGRLAVASGGGIGFVTAAAGGAADLGAAGAVAGGALAAGGSATVDAGGAVTLSGLAASNARLRSTGGAVTATGIAVGGLVEARGTGLTLVAPGTLEVAANASAGAIAITAGGDLKVSAATPGAIALTSTGGSVLVGTVGQAGGVTGGITAQAVDGGGAVSVTAANAISVADSLVAGGALTMTAGGLISLDGAARGQTIALQARDLAIGTGGALGGAGTQRVALASTSAVNLGTGAGGGFAVDAGEFGRIQSGGDLMVTALAGTGAAGSGSLTVGSLTVTAGSGVQVGAAGTFGLTANGLLDVNTTLGVARGGAGTTLMLAGDTVDLDYANAALSVMDTANSATGRIAVSGRLITSMSAAAAADIVGKTPAEISARLGQADTVREIGLFRTGALSLEGRDAILIQNSGGAAADARRGLTVGALTVTGAANGNTLVVINGIVNNATGNNAAQNVTVSGTLAAGSSFNGCVLANIAGCFVLPEPEPPLILAPDAILFGTSDLIKEDEEDSEVEDGVADGQPEAPPIDTTRIDDPAGQPMIDDPVTGAGNEDLWQQPDE